jgi:enoyl-CoA hydratase/carnithine racemase
MAYQQIQFFAEDAIGILTLDNPKKINALSKQMVAEIPTC